MEWVVSDAENGVRLDQFLARKLAEHFSRSHIKKLIEAGDVRLTGQRLPSAHYRVKSGENIELKWQQPEREETRAEAIPIDIVYEDEDLLVVNKPAGMVVHPAHGNPVHTLVNALLYHVRHLSGAGGPIRPGIVHRLDKDTSGILVVAKNDRAHFSLAKQFRTHRIERIYQAFVKGVVQHDEGEINEPVGRAFLNRKKVVVKPSGGKQALTYYRVKRRFHRVTWLEIKPQTGRTHQIRVHLAHIGHPILGDSFYGTKAVGIDRQALHAGGLGFTHPRTREKLHFEVPLPEDIKALTRLLESNS